jgi:uncharacterized protein (DUF302 family)
MACRNRSGLFGVAAVAFLVSVGPGVAQDMTSVRSSADFTATKTKLVDAVKARGFTVVAEVDHAAGARANGLELRPTHLVIFGNPRGGTPLMACNQTAGIDLPLKALIWQAADGTVNVTVNTPKLIADRHKLGDCGAQPMTNMGNAMQAILADIAKP